MTLSLAQIFLLSLAVLVTLVVIARYRQRRIGTRSLLLWLLLWSVAAFVILFPDTTVEVAQLLGIGRGTDLVLYLSVIFIFYLLFRVIVRFERIDREITLIVRTLALRPPAGTLEGGEETDDISKRSRH